jgi:hypothetical protein
MPRPRFRLPRPPLPSWPDVLFFGGLALLGLGIGQHDAGAGLAVPGALLIVFVVPVKKWWG